MQAFLLGLLFLLCFSAAHARDVLQQFLLASRADDVAFIFQMDELGLDTRTRDDLGNTLLMLAIREGSSAMALGLMDRPAWQAKEVLDAENKLGENALMVAALKGSIQPASRLLALGAQANRHGWGPLHYAATTGQTKLVELLVEAASYVDAESPNGTTPLMMAARFNHREVAQALIGLGADPTLTNQAGLTARDYARENNNNDLAFWLELEEITFTNKYLRKLPQIDLDKILAPTDGPAQPVEPAKGVEVLQGVR